MTTVILIKKPDVAKIKLAEDIKLYISWLRRNVESMSFDESYKHIKEIDRLVDMYRTKYGKESDHAFAWYEYERPYINMLVSNIRVYPVI